MHHLVTLILYNNFLVKRIKAPHCLVFSFVQKYSVCVCVCVCVGGWVGGWVRVCVGVCVPHL